MTWVDNVPAGTTGLGFEAMLSAKEMNRAALKAWIGSRLGILKDTFERSQNKAPVQDEETATPQTEEERRRLYQSRQKV